MKTKKETIKISEIDIMIDFLTKERNDYINKFSIRDLFCKCKEDDDKYESYSNIIFCLYDLKNKNLKVTNY